MIKGKDYIWVGCWAFILNENNELLLMKRNKNCRNKAGYWSIPGWGVDFWETMHSAIIRETMEEIGVKVEVLKLLCYTDDIISEENQHWLGLQFLCKIIEWEVNNLEPHKCEEIKWFSLNNLPSKLTKPTINWVKYLK